MLGGLRIFPFGLALLFAGSALAQTPLRVAQANKATAQAPAAAQGTGTPQTPPPPQPLRTEILNFDNWNVTCREFAEGKRKRVCFAQLQIIQQANSQVVFAWTIGSDDDNKQIMSLQTPTGVAIVPGVDLKLSKGSRTLPYTACESGHCVATLPVDATLVRDLAASGDVQAIIHASDGREVTINIPMKGFDKAYAALPR